MFDSTDTLSAVSADSSVREAAVEAPAPTFYIGDTPILRGKFLRKFSGIKLRRNGFWLPVINIRISLLIVLSPHSLAAKVPGGL